MVYNIPYILTNQISGIFKGTWKNKECWLKNICNSNNGVWISLNNSKNKYEQDKN